MINKPKTKTSTTQALDYASTKSEKPAKRSLTKSEVIILISSIGLLGICTTGLWLMQNID